MLPEVKNLDHCMEDNRIGPRDTRHKAGEEGGKWIKNGDQDQRDNRTGGGD